MGVVALFISQPADGVTSVLALPPMPLTLIKAQLILALRGATEQNRGHMRIDDLQVCRRRDQSVTDGQGLKL